MSIPTTAAEFTAFDASHLTPHDAVPFVAAFFAAKSGQDHEGLMALWSPDAQTYSDVPMGWAADGYAAIHDGFARAMPQFAGGASYATRILGALPDGDGSAVMAVTNTPHIAGSELRMLSAVDVRGGKVVRWVDYWDSLSYEDGPYSRLRTPADRFPRSYREDATGTAASERITDVATRLHTAFGGNDPGSATALFDYDAVFEDMGVRAQVIGQAAVARYLARVLPVAPFGVGSGLRHVLGGDLGGGFEWRCPPDFPTVDGITALELNAAGLITRATVVYDSRQLGEAQRDTLVALSTRS